MHHITVQPGNDASPEEVAAALAAVSLALEEEAHVGAVTPEAAQSGWQAAARLATQGLTPWRAPTAVEWKTIERIRRAGRGGGGIVGM